MLVHEARLLCLRVAEGQRPSKENGWKRTKEQLFNALHCNPSTQGSLSVMPIFAKDIFLQATRELGIEIVQTYGEADR